jgi:hypothetical protein
MRHPVVTRDQRAKKLPGKEMFHPQVLLRIPCYDLLPVSSFAVVPPPHHFALVLNVLELNEASCVIF